MSHSDEIEEIETMLIGEMETRGLVKVIDGITVSLSDMKELEDNIMALIIGEIEDSSTVLTMMANRAYTFPYYKDRLK